MLDLPLYLQALADIDILPVDPDGPVPPTTTTTAPPSTLVERAAAFAAGLPDDAAFSHVTAAAVLGLPLPRHLEDPAVLDVMRPTERAPTRRKSCRGHKGLDVRRVVTRLGLRVVAAPDTWCDLDDLVPADPDVGQDVVAQPAELRYRPTILAIPLIPGPEAQQQRGRFRLELGVGSPGEGVDVSRGDRSGRHDTVSLRLAGTARRALVAAVVARVQAWI